MNTAALATEAVRAASLLRSQNGIGPADGLCPYDLAIKLGIKVSTLSAPSLEGMYSPEPEPSTIILGCERPSGRRRYSCAHEIGHHIFKHGFRIDQLDESNSSPLSPEEFLAQRFASALLMPKLAVDAAFSRRGWKPSIATPEQYFIVAQNLGVGFTSLISNVEINLGYLTKEAATTLKESSLIKIRNNLSNQTIKNDLFIVDKNWSRKTIDVEIGDLILLPAETKFEGACASHNIQDKKLIAVSSGIGKIFFSEKTLDLRVSKKNFAGLARYRYLEDEE